MPSTDDDSPGGASYDAADAVSPNQGINLSILKLNTKSRKPDKSKIHRFRTSE